MTKRSDLFLRFPGGKAKALTLSYDDGVEQDIQLVEIMRRNGLKGTFNINAGCFSPEGTVHAEGKIHRRMTASQVQTAYPEDMCEVACHSYTHAFLDRCDTAIAFSEIIDDRKALESLFGRQIRGMAYPYGTTNDDVVEILRLAGIRYSRTTVSTESFGMPKDWLRLSATCHHKNPKLMALADRFITQTPTWSPWLFYLWGHTYEFEEQNNWHVIENFAEKIGGHDDIWYATNMEIYNAWHDFNQLEISADGSMIYNPSLRDVWFADCKKNVHRIGPGETVKF